MQNNLRLQVIEAAGLHTVYGFNDSDALLLHRRCSDKVSTVRRQAVTSITALVAAYPAHFALQGYSLACCVCVCL